MQLGFCEKLLSVLRRFQGGSSPSEERQNVVKTTCDLIVLVLTGDASMKHVYQNGSGPVYKTTMSWLQSEDDNLKVAGALAAGNFARKGELLSSCHFVSQHSMVQYWLWYYHSYVHIHWETAFYSKSLYNI